MMRKAARFRLYADLNDFLPKEKRQKPFTYQFWGSPSVKDAIQSLGVPHTEVTLILVNRNPVTFAYRIQHADIISAYPTFQSIDISAMSLKQDKHPSAFRFVADAHMGKLTKYLRMLGFDTLYKTHFDAQEIIRFSNEQERIILTRDVGLLMHNRVKDGYFIRATDPQQQVREILQRFHLRPHITSFTRCLDCNGTLEEVAKSVINDQLKPQTRRDFQHFYRCSSCHKIYWKGSHYDRMNEMIDQLTSASR